MSFEFGTEITTKNFLFHANLFTITFQEESNIGIIYKTEKLEGLKITTIRH